MTRTRSSSHLEFFVNKVSEIKLKSKYDTLKVSNKRHMLDILKSRETLRRVNEYINRVALHQALEPNLFM